MSLFNDYFKAVYVALDATTGLTGIISESLSNAATDLGILVRSIQVQPDFDNLRIHVVSLHSIAPYARRLEFGDMSRNLQPRPFMFKALQAQKQKATNVVQKALRDALAQMQGATP